ncbi:MAG: hypothetical protein M1818_000821 [Claussenomyces sp. TS43310]|nr:MAG: hypothetical protein M1818_000821 [Claussenomyces sp. TS43310]
MALEAVYKQFLAAPNPAALIDNASLHYITTLTTFNGPSDILKHLKTQSNQIKKKEEKFLDAVESQNALAVEVDTTMELVTSGGAYLPGLDDNFLADRTVTFPIIHIVTFDSYGKIAQMRQHWDQGSLLKLIDVIGKTGRNWPIRDGGAQAQLISESVRLAAKSTNEGTAPPTHAESVTRSRQNSSNPTRDPHASLALFAPRDHEIQNSLPAVVPPRASAKPAARDFHDLFVGHSSDDAPDAVANKDRGRPSSPHKSVVGAIAPKGGAGKNYQPSRLFDNDENSPVRPSITEKSYRAHPTKYQHFDFEDGTEAPSAPEHLPPKTTVASKSKHDSTWNFDDFNTPDKHVPGKVLRGPEARHWGNEDDEVLESPVRPKKLDKPRKDAETHFEFMDDGTPEGGRRIIGRPRGPGIDSGMGLYQNNLYADDGAPPAQAAGRALNSLTNVKDRRKDFDPHFQMTDDSPAGKDPRQSDRVPEDKAKSVKMMEANWSTYDQSPAGTQKENAGSGAVNASSRAANGKGPLSETTNSPSQRNDGITIGGDGMGGRKGASQRNLDNKRINVGGDGMGGRKGAGRAWALGDESEEEEMVKPARKLGVERQATGGDFWNY